jgi:SAM-dependent methyltransferase
MKLYNELAEYYYSIERENRNIDNDIRMIRTLVKDIEKPVLLDIGCGTGEHAHKLTMLGIICTGIDSSSAMIDTARIRFPNSIRFMQQDMRDFDFKEKFDIAISLFGSIDYLIDEEEIHSVFRNTKKCLKPGGIGVFEVWNAFPIQKIKEKPLSFVSKTEYGEKIIERRRGFRLLNNHDATIVEVDYDYKISGDTVIKDRHIMRAFTCDELREYLAGNGFQIIAIYSNTLMRPYKETSNRIIVHFRKEEE